MRISTISWPLLVFICGLGMSSCEPEAKHDARDFVILVSPGLSDVQKNIFWKTFGKFLSGGTGKKADPDEGMAMGDSIHLLDASTLNEIAPLTTVPANARTSVLQHNAMQPVMTALGNFFKETKPSDVAVDLPALVDGNLGKIPDASARVLIVGSPLMHDDEARDMRKGWPTDGFFSRDPLVSPFSTKNKDSMLRGMKIRFCTPDTTWAEGFENAHKEGVRRFWALYLSQCGGSLVSFQNDINQGFRDLLSDNLSDLVDEFNFAVNPQETEMEMRRTAFAATPAAATNPIAVAQSWLQTSAEDWNRANNAPSYESIPDKAPIQVGLCWDTQRERVGSDLDLHIRMKGEKGELFFRNQETAFGKSSKDLFADEKASHGYELAKITKPCNPGDLEVWVNAYAGQSSTGFAGQVRVMYGGRLMVYPFAIPAKTGNKGSEKPSREKNPNWIRIDISRPT